MIPWIRTTLVALVVCTPLPFGSVRPWAVLGLQLAAAGLVAALLSTADGRSRLSALLGKGGVAFLVAACSVPLAQLLAPSDLAALSPPEAVDAWARWLAFVALGTAAAAAFGEASDTRRLLAVAALSGSCLAAYGVTEYLSGRQHIFWIAKVHYLDSASGTFVNRNHFGIHLAALLPLALALAWDRSGPGPSIAAGLRAPAHLSRRLIYSTCAVVLTAGIVLSFSRTALAAAVVSVVAWTLLAAETVAQRIRVLAPVVLGAFAVVAFTYVLPGERFTNVEEMTTLNNRLSVWRAALSEVPSRPAIGFGVGAFEPALANADLGASRSRWDHAHNEWIQTLVETGFSGLLLVAIFCGVLLHRWRRRRSPAADALLASLLALCVGASADFPFRIPAIATLACILVGALFGITAARPPSRELRAVP